MWSLIDLSLIMAMSKLIPAVVAVVDVTTPCFVLFFSTEE